MDATSATESAVGGTACDRAREASLSTDLGFGLGVVFRSYVKYADLVVDSIPGGARGFQVLAAAVYGEANTQTALAQRLGVDRTVMTYVVDDLEKARLVRRKPDPLDRRGRQIIATKKGEDLWSDIEARLRTIEDHVLGVLDDGERTTFRNLLSRLAVRAHEADPVNNPCSLVELADG